MNRDALVAMLVLAALPASGHAQNAGRQLVQARASLGTYDTHSDGTTRVIADLGSLARRARGRDATEARFLRAIAAADLLIIADRRNDTRLLERVARAWGAEPERLRAALRTELQALRVGSFRDTAEDALSALTARETLSIPITGVVRTRREAVFFARVFERLLHEEDAQVLADLAADPCENGAECPEPYRHFGPRGRRAIAAMSALNAVQADLQETAEMGDPFSAALAREVLVDALLLQSMTLAPRDWASGIEPVAAGERGPSVDADAAIVLGPDQLRIGWVPQVRFEDGRPQVEARGAPLVADSAESRFSFRIEADGFLRPIEGLPEHLAAHLQGAERIAVVIEPGVPAFGLSRVIASLEAARLRPAVLAGASADGALVGASFLTIHGEADTPVGVFVRLGGFSTWQPAGRESLPRLREGDAWRFDMGGLDRATVQRTRHSVSVRYMGTAAADLVLRVALIVGDHDRPIQLVLP